MLLININYVCKKQTCHFRYCLLITKKFEQRKVDMKVENFSSKWPRNEEQCKTVLDTARAGHSVELFGYCCYLVYLKNIIKVKTK